MQDLEYDRGDKIDHEVLVKPLPFFRPHELKALKDLEDAIFVPEEIPELHWGTLVSL